MSVTDITKSKAKKEQEHADRVVALFRDHPELAKRAIIIALPTDGTPGLCLAPQDLSPTEVVGTLETAKFNIIMQALPKP